MRSAKRVKALKPAAIKTRAARALKSARNDLSANILLRRATLRLSQADLAERSGVSRPVISKIETGRGDFQVSALAKVAAVLDCPIADLLAPGAVGRVSDAEIANRFPTARENFVDGGDLWAALDEVTESRKVVVASMEGPISPRGRKRSPSPSLNGRKKK